MWQSSKQMYFQKLRESDPVTLGSGDARFIHNYVDIYDIYERVGCGDLLFGYPIYPLVGWLESLYFLWFEHKCRIYVKTGLCPDWFPFLYAILTILTTVSA